MEKRHTDKKDTPAQPAGTKTKDMTEPTGKYKFSKRGNGRTQKRIGVAIDSELEDWLNLQSNKNRYINGLIRQDQERFNIRAVSKTTSKTEGEILTEMREAWEEKRQRQVEEKAKHRRKPRTEE